MRKLRIPVAMRRTEPSRSSRALLALACAALLCCGGVSAAEKAYADSEQEWVNERYRESRTEKSGAEDTVGQRTSPEKPGSDAQFDDRLPPVLPGEVVSDSGRRMRVWSSSGPVPVNSAPPAACTGDAGGACTGSIDPSKISVIVDPARNVPRK